MTQSPHHPHSVAVGIAQDTPIGPGSKVPLQWSGQWWGQWSGQWWARGAWPIIALGVLSLCLGARESLADPAAREVVEDFHAALIQAMKEPECETRYRLLDPVVRENFDLPRIARLSAGSFWRKSEEPLRRRFLDTLTRSTIASYADNFAGHDGESFRTIASDPWKSGMMIQTRLIRDEDEDVRFDYVLGRDKDGTWRIVDILLKGSYSELATRRSQYLSILRQSGMEGLIDRIDEKIPPQCRPS